MYIKKLLSQLPNIKILQQAQDQEITNIVCSSKDAQPGAMFFAIKGDSYNGNDFITDAIDNGASFIIFEKTQQSYVVEKLKQHTDINVYLLAVDDIKQCLVEVANIFWPNKPEHIVAVTGTSGKTSVAWFTNHLWQILGKKSSFIGTLGVSAFLQKDAKNLTTPSILDLYKILDKLKRDNINYVIMEASSHGIEQGRLNNIHLSAAAFTNFGRDHLDYHGDSDNYFKAKMQLFEKLLPKNAPALIFADDKYSEKVCKKVKDFNDNILTIGTTGDYIKVLYKHDTEFALRINNKIYIGDFLLSGNFQWYNALIALGIVLKSGVDVEEAVKALCLLQTVPGRMQFIGKNKAGSAIYVDYAHKPEALESVLTNMRNFTKGKIILVFGCGGNRDAGKRAIMGEIAQKLADIVIITDDNPRFENPQDIRKAILLKAPKAIEIGSRAKAIKKAIDIAKKNDNIIIAGKGHETGQQIGDKLEHFSDEEEVKKWIKPNE